MSRLNKAPISLSRLARYMKGKDGKIAVIVGAVTNDARLLEVPALTVCALRFTADARYFQCYCQHSSSVQTEFR